MRISVAVLTAAGIVAAVVGLPAVRGQSSRVEVATVKVNRSDNGASNPPRLTNGRLTAENVSLKQILQVAYGLAALQIGGPGWLDSDRFDLAANAPQGVKGSDMMPMLQSLLKERF